ncbi:MAG: hypothetical protein NTW19_04585 [Planctomycetota bacterium]|nr:hypothetical protein [Planctomycetota bacterium]
MSKSSDSVRHPMESPAGAAASGAGGSAMALNASADLGGTPLEEFGEEVTRSPKPAGAKRTLFERVEAYISRLSTRNRFWHIVCSFIWLPYAFKSGITMKRMGPNSFMAVLPFRRVNRNWYNAMAGGALLGNAEIAGGMYVFGICGADYTVVCKEMQYKFLRPCFGPALYRITAREDMQNLIATSTEFNITLDMQVLQQPVKPKDKAKRCGRCEITFHVTPKASLRPKAARKG